MKVRLLAGAFALLACMASIAGTASAKTTTAATPHYYLALGDSLSVGYQPNSAGVGKETTQGYVNDIYAQAKKKIKNLKLVEVGCPGATTTSLLTGSGNPIGVKDFDCIQTGGSQLTAAEKFLKAHDVKGEVSLITIDIGANDVDGCVADASQGIGAIATCVSDGVTAIEKNTPKILAGIKKYAAKGALLAGMNLYDPILADEISSVQSTQSLGTLSLALVKEVNAAITKADTAAGFHTANVAKYFDTYDTTPVTATNPEVTAAGFSTIPQDVENICDLTWMCAAAPVGPNIHANQQGYALIAQAFEAVLPKQF